MTDFDTFAFVMYGIVLDPEPEPLLWEGDNA